MADTANLKLPLMEAAQSQKHVTHNEALELLDAIVQLTVLDIRATPPGSAADGDRYIIASGATGAWDDKDLNIALRRDGAWSFIVPEIGWLAWVQDESRLLAWNGAAWADFIGSSGLVSWQGLAGGDIAQVGVNTTADFSNRLAVKSDGVMFSHDDVTPGSGHMRIAVNKSLAARDASIGFQQAAASRFLLGLLGSNDLTLKYSPNGTSFPAPPALVVNHKSGRVTVKKLQSGVRPFDVVRRSHVAVSPWLLSSTPADNSWRSVVWVPEEGWFVAVANTGSGNRAMTSPDGIAWTARATPDNTWAALAWSPELGRLVAVAETGTASGLVMTSPGGIVWTPRTSPAGDSTWFDVEWSPELGLFVAIAWSGTGDRIMTSPDGFTWTPRPAPAANQWTSLVWAAELGLFVAVASSGAGNRVMTSPDGITWTLRTSAADLSWRCVCWSPELGLLVAVAWSGSGNRIMTSPDGITWTSRTSPADNNWSSAVWSPELGLFCASAISGTGNRIMTSPDGIAWSLRTSAGDNQWYSLAWSPELGLFAAVGATGTGNRSMTSVSAHSYPYRS